jgi:bifunctional DNA-binding transcriptional regulator/antitoxin component of YhaV-PrlF toxin-antitoxin module
MEVETKKVDAQGRVSLPPDWRRENLEENREVVIQRTGDKLIISAKSKPDLTKHFDSVIVDIPPEAFKDPETLRKALNEADI